MAHITYRQGVDTSTNSSTTTKNSGLSNIEIDKNFRTLDSDKLDKVTTAAQTVASVVTFSNNIVISGNLEVNGTTTTINSTTLAIDDKNIVLGDVATPTNVTADGGGITLKGTTDKTLNWVNADAAWTSSEHVKLAAGKNVVLSGATSGTVTLATAAVAGTTTITFPATTGNVVTTGDSGTVTNAMLAGSIANGKLANSSVTIGTTAINLGAASTVLAGLTSVTSTSFVGNVTGNVTGNADTATKLATARAINGVNFDGSAGITITANTPNALALKFDTGSTEGTDLYTFNGSAAKTVDIKAGTNVSITKAAGVITIASSNPGGTVTSVTGTAPIAVANGTTTPAISISAATQSAAGSMSATDKTKLDGIAANANNYSLPLAADGARGGVQIGFATDNPGRNYAVQLSSEKMYVNVPWTDNNTITTVGVGAAAGVSGDVKLIAGTNVTISRTNQDITINSSYVDTNTTYSIKASTQTGGAGLDLDAGGSGSGTDTVKILGSTGTTVTRTDADTITISSTSVGDGTLSTAAVTAGATNTTVALSLSGAYSANTTNNRTINPVVGPAITNLATLMTSGNTGFIKRTGQDTYSIDTNTYLTSYTETSTLAQVLSRGNTIGPAPATYFINWAAPSGPFSAGTNLQSEVLRFTNTGPTTSGISSEYKSINCIDSNGPIASIRIGNGSDRMGRIEFGNMTHWSGVSQTYGNSTYPIIMRALSSNGASAILEVTSGDIRSPIFYEYNNTSVYLDLASTGTSLSVAGGGFFNSNVTVSTYLGIYSDSSTRLLQIIGPTGTGLTTFRNSASNNGFAFTQTNSDNNLFVIDSSGNTTSTGNVTAYSDARLKTNVKTLENSLEKTLKLRGVSYQKDGKDGVGVIAQEIREVLPEVVIEGDDQEKTLSVAYGNVVGLLIEAIKELNAKVEDLQKQLSNK